MTQQTARTLANLLLASAGIAAAYAVYTTPPLKRLARLAVKRWLGAGVPLFLLSEARQAWADAGRNTPASGRRRA
jgi:hypothetical protein